MAFAYRSIRRCRFYARPLQFCTLGATLEYSAAGRYLIFCLVLAILAVLVARGASPRLQSYEKLSAYECGFEPFADARAKFDVTFVLIAILLLIFDSEIFFPVPWVTNVAETGFLGFCIIFCFLSLLVSGFLLELLRGAVEWDRDFF